MILSETDLVERMSHILKFCMLYVRSATEEEDEHWFYCNQTNIKLLPTFFYDMADETQLLTILQTGGLPSEIRLSLELTRLTHTAVRVNSSGGTYDGISAPCRK